MKRKLIVSLALSALLLSACNSDSVQDTAESDVPESYTTGSYQLYFSESLAERGSETEEAFETETTSEPETETSVPEETENVPAEAVFTPDDAPYRIIDLLSLYPDGENLLTGRAFFNGDMICVLCHIIEDEEVTSSELRFCNIKEGTFEGSVPLPEGWDLQEYLGGGYGDVFCKALIRSSSGVGEDYKEENSVLTVYNDYTYDISEYTLQNSAVERGGHKISDMGIDLTCADGEPKIIVAGYDDGVEGWISESRYQYYRFPIDEKRFVYRTGGYEWMPCFGIYDFETDTAADVPDSQDLFPVGVYGGEIYSVKTAWDGYGGTELYVTDIGTLETSLFLTFPTLHEYNESINYFMPQSGSHIIAVKEYERTAAIYSIAPDTADITFICDLTDDFYFGGTGEFIDENTFVMRGNSKLVILTISE